MACLEGESEEEMLKERKIKLVDELAEKLEKASTLIVADYRGLSVADFYELRSELYRHGAQFTVVKNTLTLRAAEKAGIKDLDEFLTGPTAIVFVTGGDIVATAKALVETAKQTNVLSLKGGILDGRKIESGDVVQLAELPPLDILQGTVVGVIAAPLTHLVSLFSAPLRDFVGVLDAYQGKIGALVSEPLEDQGEEAGGVEAALPEEDVEVNESESRGAEESPVSENTDVSKDEEGINDGDN
tara:strand:+ start:847 stop:1575 length:729 start_codon:yes stop_codon:yes gene_type:complete